MSFKREVSRELPGTLIARIFLLCVVRALVVHPRADCLVGLFALLTLVGSLVVVGAQVVNEVDFLPEKLLAIHTLKPQVVGMVPKSDFALKLLFALLALKVFSKAMDIHFVFLK